MAALVRIIDIINEWAGKVVSWIILVLIGIVIFEIVMRYVFTMPTIWVHEMGMYLFGAMWVLGGGYTLLNKAMVNMDVFYGSWSERTKAILDLCTVIFSLLVVVILFWKSSDTAWGSLLRLERSGSAWDPPYYPVRLILPLGAFLLLIQLVSKLVKDIFVLRYKE